MMFDFIHNHPELTNLLRQTCRENGVGATIHPDLLDANGDLLHERVVVIKLDALYHSQNMHNPPPSPDYLVIVKCCNGDYEGYIIELRDTGQTALVRPKEIVGKFLTAINDFILERYSHVFVRDGLLVFRKLKLYLVTDPLRAAGLQLSADEYKKKIQGTVLDAYGAMKPIQVQQHLCMIEPLLPDPMIEPCH